MNIDKLPEQPATILCGKKKPGWKFIHRGTCQHTKFYLVPTQEIPDEADGNYGAFCTYCGELQGIFNLVREGGA